METIPDADAILKATVLGWQLVVRKGEFVEGDLCVYCEIDSIMPDKPEFEFVRERGNRIRTIRLRGQVSQGVCFPLSILPIDAEVEEGKDVTDVIGVEKYEPPVPASLQGIAKGPFPNFIPKTDETRVQILQELLDKYEGTNCYITEKLDGSSVTYFLKKGVFSVASRNLELIETEDNTLWKVARSLDIENKLQSLGKDYALQGELVGEFVQGNKYKLKAQTAFFFNVFDIDAYRYLNFEEYTEMLARLDLKSVPILDTNYTLQNNIETLVEMSKGKSALYDVMREGIVIRTLTELRDVTGRVSFKSINPDFLLKYEE